MKTIQHLRIGVTALLVAITTLAYSAPWDTEWKKVTDTIEELKKPKERAKSREEAIERAKKKVETLDEAYDAAMKVSKDHPSRWTAAVTFAEIERLREIIGASPFAGISEEITAATKATNIRPEDKAAAEKIQKKLETAANLKSKPLDLKFTAVDGREVDLSKMRGKVVLIDFWATWCGPCVAELPNVKKTYDALHPKGFEIIGISLDSDKEKLTSFLKEKDMAWPQFYDGKGWKNEIASNYDIHSIPAMWLVNKEGMLIDMNAREGLEKKVSDLLK